MAGTYTGSSSRCGAWVRSAADAVDGSSTGM